MKKKILKIILIVFLVKKDIYANIHMKMNLKFFIKDNMMNIQDI